MRLRTDFVFILILVFGASTGVVQAQEYSANPDSSFDAPDLTVMSFNIRYDNPGDGEDAWPNRADGVAALVEQHRVDVVGLQEALPRQLADLERLLPGFAWLGVSRGGEGADDEFSAILYRVTSVIPVDHGTFWLSETPDEPASRGWDAALPRIATWARFRLERTGDGDQTGADAPADAPADSDALEFLVLNTHFDHRGETARVESARLIRRRLAERAGILPVVVTGDFNATPETDPIRILTATDGEATLRDALNASVTPHEGPLSTWNGFDAVVADRRIDYVFIGSGVQVLRHAVLGQRLDSGRFPSDHLPVLAEISFQPARSR